MNARHETKPLPCRQDRRALLRTERALLDENIAERREFLARHGRKNFLGDRSYVLRAELRIRSGLRGKVMGCQAGGKEVHRGGLRCRPNGTELLQFIVAGQSVAALDLRGGGPVLCHERGAMKERGDELRLRGL